MTRSARIDLGTAISKPDEFRIVYEITNEGSEPIYPLLLCKDIWELLGPRGEMPSDEIAQMCWAGEDRLHVLFGRAPQKTANIVSPSNPFAVRINPGKVYRGTLCIPLPVAEWSLYEPQVTDGANVRAVEINLIHFRLEYAVEGDGAAVIPEACVPPIYRLGYPARFVEADLDVSEHQLILLTRSNMSRFHDYDGGP